ncbi:MAG: exonuclease domain-containing protein [Candidatus Krumholzibacteriia bacterium]
MTQLRDQAHRYLLEADRPVESQHIARHLFGPQRHEMPEAQVVVRSLLDADPRFLRTHCRRWSARWAPHLQLPLAEAAFAVVDLETTGSLIGVDEIMEVGLVRVERGRVVTRYTTRVRATRGIPPWVSRLTGISEADLVQAPEFEEVTPALLELLDDAVFVAHDIRFDQPFLRWELVKRDLEFPCQTGLCTLQLSRALWPDLPSHSLGELASSLGVAHGQPHRAGDDAEAASGVLMRAMTEAVAMGRVTLGDLMELDPGRTPAARRSTGS